MTSLAPLDDLGRLLEPYEDLTLGRFRDDDFRFVDAPPATVRQVLALLDPEIAESRPNDQPPARWLLDCAEQLGGKVSGHAATARRFVRVDALCVVSGVAADLVRRVEDAWPADGEMPAALDLATAEVWARWDSTRSAWEGVGSDLLRHADSGTVVGLWWD